MSCASFSFQTMRNLPYPRLKDLCENHEKFSSSKPEVQSMLCELLSRGQEQEPICQERLMDRKVSEIVRTIACKAIQGSKEADRKAVLSLAARTISAANADQTKGIAENISSFLSLPEVQNVLSRLPSRREDKDLILQELLMNEKVSEIVRAITCKAIPKGREIDPKSVLSMVCATVSAAGADQVLVIAQGVSSLFLVREEIQRTLRERFSGGQEKEPICGGPLDKKASEGAHAIAFDTILNNEKIDQKIIMSVTVKTVATADAEQTVAIPENISSCLLLEAMEEYVPQAEELHRWVEEDPSRSEAAKAILSFLIDPSSHSLRLWDQGLTSLPRFVSKKWFDHLRFLYLGHNKLKKFPELPTTKALEHLSIIDNEISAIPQKAEGIGFIQELYLNGNQIPAVPDDLTGFWSLRNLSLQHNQIGKIPEKVSFPDSLEVLSLSGNQIPAIPEKLEGLEKVKRLYLANNKITKIPSKLKGLENLELLSLSGNNIPIFPKKIEGLGNLKDFYFLMDFLPPIEFLQSSPIEFLRGWGLRSLENYNF